MRSYMGKLAVTAILLVILVQLPTRAAEEQRDQSIQEVLNQAPADASLILLVPNLAQFSEKVASLNDALELGIPELASLLAEVKREVGLTEGLKDDGPAVLAFRLVEPEADAKPQAAEAGAAGGQPADQKEVAMMLFVPTADRAALRASLQAEEKDGMTQIVTRDGHTAFAGEAGPFTVVTQRRDVLESYKPGQGAESILKQLGTVGRAAMNRSDAVLILHGEGKVEFIKTLEAQSTQQMKQGMEEAQRQEAEAEGEIPMPGMDETMAQNMMMEQMKELAKWTGENSPWLHETEALLVGLDLGDDGIGLTVTMQTREGTGAAKALTQGGGASEILARMPKDPYMFTMAFSTEGINPEALGKTGPQMFGAASAEEWVRQVLWKTGEAGGAKGIAEVMYMPPADAQGGGMGAMGMGMGLSRVMCVATDDPKEFVAQLKTHLDELNAQAEAAAEAAAQADPQAPPALTMTRQVASAQYMANRLQLEGQQVDQYVVRFQPLPMQMMGQMGPMAMLGGMSDDKSGYIVEGDKLVIITESADLTTLKRLLASLKNNAGLGQGDDIAAVREQLFGDPAIEGYLDMSTTLSAFGPVLAMFGVPIMPPDDLQPIAIGGEVRDHGLAWRFYVPMSVARFTATTANALRMQMEQMQQMQGQGQDMMEDEPQRSGPRPAPH